MAVYGVFHFTNETTAKMLKMVEEHRIRPLVGKVFGYRDAKRAFEALSGQDAMGKIVVEIE